MPPGLSLHELEDGRVRFEVQVTPRASRTQILGVHDGALKLSLNAPPVDGAANDALLRFLAKALRIPTRDLSVVRGHSARRKLIEARGEDLARRLLSLG